MLEEGSLEQRLAKHDLSTSDLMTAFRHPPRPAFRRVVYHGRAETAKPPVGGGGGLSVGGVRVRVPGTGGGGGGAPAGRLPRGKSRDPGCFCLTTARGGDKGGGGGGAAGSGTGSKTTPSPGSWLAVVASASQGSPRGLTGDGGGGFIGESTASGATKTSGGGKS